MILKLEKLEKKIARKVFCIGEDLIPRYVNNVVPECWQDKNSAKNKREKKHLFYVTLTRHTIRPQTLSLVPPFLKPSFLV